VRDRNSALAPAALLGTATPLLLQIWGTVAEGQVVPAPMQPIGGQPRPGRMIRMAVARHNPAPQTL